MSLYRQGEAEALESFPYGQICSYGVSDSNTFKITAGDRDLLFETTKVQSARSFHWQGGRNQKVRAMAFPWRGERWGVGGGGVRK